MAAKNKKTFDGGLEIKSDFSYLGLANFSEKKTHFKIDAFTFTVFEAIRLFSKFCCAKSNILPYYPIEILLGRQSKQ